ncbi:MAG TPA: Lpg1974 family pore-forming outer membrane protein [Pseudolabrys sp.]|nr:Lpg1974 family pore-forming outer membrane protein [Pseudolabrys sp.]
MSNVRRSLFVSVSTIALAAASSAVSAADLPVKAPAIAPAPPPRDLWTWWVEGGAFRTEQDALFGLSAPLTGISPHWGWEAAVGFDYRMGAFSPYHLSGQFRYGAARRSSGLFSRTESFIGGTQTPFSRSTSPIVGTGTGSGDVKEHHWLVDFAVGRDFALGSGMTQAKFGIRVAELYSKATANEFFFGSFGPGSTTVSGNISFSNRSRFLGIGPRLGIEGSVPFAGSWSFDYLGGVAVLIGERKLDSATSTAALLYNGGPTTIVLPSSATAFSSSDTAAIFNLDAQAGISYWITRSFKMTASYRFDGYWNALRTIDLNGNVSNEDRFYHGPMLRATMMFGG